MQTAAETVWNYSIKLLQHDRIPVSDQTPCQKAQEKLDETQRSQGDEN